MGTLGIDAVLLRAEVEELLFRECALLDAREFDAWLELYAEDAIYWIPGSDADDDPSQRVSIVYERRDQLRERVWRLGSGLAYAQEPASRTAHLIGNVRVVASDRATIHAESVLTVTEYRRERVHVHAGRCIHHLRREDGRLSIASKRIELVENVGHLGNLSLLL